MLNRFGIKGKLLLLCTLLSAFTVGVGTVGVISLHSVSEKYERVANINLPNIQSLGRMNGAFRRAQVYAGVLAADDIPVQRANEAMKGVDEGISSYEESLKEYLAVPFSPGEEELYKKVEANWTTFKVSLKAVVDAYKAKDMLKVNHLVGTELLDNGITFRSTIDTLVNYHDKNAEASVAQARDIASKSNVLAISMAIIGFLVAMTLGFLFSRALSNTLNEVAQSLNAGANEVAGASSQIASSSEQLSAAVTEQAAALQETAASIEEMSAMVTKNTENCAKTNELSNSSQGSATNGKKIVGEMIIAIQEINTSNEQMAAEIESSNQEISSIIKVIAEIGNKTKVINDIVFQTKLLSFNASVEAARAGEHGKGFAVVAEEVGNLAQMSGNASREISGMLEESISKVEGIVTNMKTKVERSVAAGKIKVETGAQIAQQCGEVLDAIVGSVSQVNTTVEEIATASKEQDHGVREVSKAMAQLDQVTQQNSSACQETASAAEELSAQADILRTSVTRLMNTIQGEGSAIQHSYSSGGHSNGPSGRNTTVRKAVASQPKAPVISIQRAVRTEKKTEGTRMLATGTSGSIPSANDSRFEDV